MVILHSYVNVYQAGYLFFFSMAILHCNPDLWPRCEVTCAPPLEGSPATFECPADNAPGMQLEGARNNPNPLTLW